MSIGKRNAKPKNDIEIGGMGIRNLHAKIEKQEDSKIYIEPISEEEEDSGCCLNGSPITGRVELMHFDRLTFGTNNMFIVLIPGA